MAGLRGLALAGPGRSLRVVRLPGQVGGGDDVPVTKRQEELAAFCVVANIAEETAHGEGGLELRRGVKHFPPGAKVWVLPPQWGDGADQLIIAGHHRGTRGHGFARMVLARRHLTGFRVRGVYSPALIRALTRPLSELGHDHVPRLWQTARSRAGHHALADPAAHRPRRRPVLHDHGHRLAACRNHLAGPEVLPGALQRASGDLFTAPAASRTIG
jgi:hypothetical protein